MKKTYLIYSLVLLNVSLACSQKENHPPIEDSNKDLYSLEKIVDGIDIPWGMSFTSTNSFLVTDKKGILYHVSDGKKSIVEGTPEVIARRSPYRAIQRFCPDGFACQLPDKPLSTRLAPYRQLLIAARYHHFAAHRAAL